jgi:hypothetical protein
MKTTVHWDNPQPIWFEEVCHDGIIYLVSSKGGITHKIDPQRASFGGALYCPTKELK